MSTRSPFSILKLSTLTFFFLSFIFSRIPVAFSGEAWERVQKTGELRWGGDAAGGAPYVFADPENPTQLIGFELEIMNAVARELGVKAVFVNVPWDQLVPALLRDDFDLAFNGLEITEDRLQSINFTVPYYFFSEQITTQSGDKQFKTLDDLRGRRAGTLSASLAQNILENHGGIEVVAYPSPLEAYKDLEVGRIQAVLLDIPIAAFYAAANPKLQNVGDPVGEGIYAGGIRKDSPVFKDKMDLAFIKLIQSGELERIYRKWNMWTANQKKLNSQILRRSAPQNDIKDVILSEAKDLSQIRGKTSLSGFAPLILKGAVMTIVLSLFSMALAVLAGFLLCLGKLYGGSAVKFFCNAYIEIIRGTPLLIQLYLLYYGLPNLGIQLNAFVAAVLGLGLNYAAYEAEIYRAGLLSISKGQDEAARSIGMSTRQALRFIIVPQAVRVILPPSTNDFIALFKDTSLVSIITVMELTRAYTQAATTTYRFLEFGLATAFLYFLMSFPLSLWSRAMERSREYAPVY